MTATNGATKEATLTAEAFHEEMLSPLGNTRPYFKACFQGFQGAGKSYTAALVAIGLCKKIGAKRVYAVENEGGGAFLAPIFEKEGIETLAIESRSLADVVRMFRLCRAASERGEKVVLLIDSASVIWEDLLVEGRDALNHQSFDIADLSTLKRTWRENFARPFVDAKFHCIYTARAGFVWEDEENESTGRRQSVKGALRSRLEGESDHEPDLIVHMERVEENGTEWHRATVLKDRSPARLGERRFKLNPRYEDFADAIDFRLANALKPHAFKSESAATLIRTDREVKKWKDRRDAAREKIEACFRARWTENNAQARREKDEARLNAFGTVSETEVWNLPLERLEAGLSALDGRKHENGRAAEGERKGTAVSQDRCPSDRPAEPSGGVPRPPLAARPEEIVSFPGAVAREHETKLTPIPTQKESASSAPDSYKASESVTTRCGPSPVATESGPEARSLAASFGFSSRSEKLCQSCKKVPGIATRFDGLWVCEKCAEPPEIKEEAPGAEEASAEATVRPPAESGADASRPEPSPECESCGLPLGAGERVLCAPCSSEAQRIMGKLEEGRRDAEGRPLLGGAAQTVPGTQASRGIEAAKARAARDPNAPRKPRKPRAEAKCKACGAKKSAINEAGDALVRGPNRELLCPPCLQARAEATARGELPSKTDASADLVAEAFAKAPESDGNGWDGGQ